MLEFFNNIKRHFALNQMASFFKKVDRNPVTRTPKEIDLEFDDISFTSSDNINLKAWYIPSKNSNKIVIFNHFMLGNRAGAVPHKDWGNINVDFFPIYKHLVDAGYNIFTYDLRNHGESDIYKGGKLGLTLTEYQDAIGASRYVKDNYPKMDVYIYSQCYGTVATIRAMDKSPEDFIHVRAFINIQPLTPEGFVTGATTQFGLAHKNNINKFGKALEKKTGYKLENLGVPSEAVKIPTLTVQVKKDWRTTVEPIQEIHNNISNNDKKMFWIEDETERLEGYNYFSKNPKELINWLDKH
jgi:hypothetical protein